MQSVVCYIHVILFWNFLENSSVFFYLDSTAFELDTVLFECDRRIPLLFLIAISGCHFWRRLSGHSGAYLESIFFLNLLFHSAIVRNYTPPSIVKRRKQNHYVL